MRKYSILLACLIFSGCASFSVNPPLKQAGNAEGYSFNNILNKEKGVGDNLVVLTFSGGGARAAALAYGVMEEMDQVKLENGKSLLDETKIISSVSGGSFTAAYYGLYGKEKFFRDFESNFLDQKLTRRLLMDLFRFKNWIPLAFSASAGRSDLGERIYDRKLFKGHTFADMPRKWPFIIINSTDMTRGNVFSFTQEAYDLLCSDLDRVRIARAVMASSALPGPFTPLTIKNYPKSQCGYEEPAWVSQALAQHPEKNLEYYSWAQDVRSYEDASVRPYIHVFDGGISDNIGLRPILFAFRTGLWHVLNKERQIPAKRLILIVVDSKPAPNYKLDQRANVPGLMAFLNSAATKPMGNYSTATIKDFMSRFTEGRQAAENYGEYQKLCDAANSADTDRKACYGKFKFPFGGVLRPPYPDTYLIHVQFEALQDPELRKTLGKIKTDMQLPKKDVDLLIEAGGTILRTSPDFQRLMADLETQKKEVKI